jgi:hypothetical protein
MNFTEKEHLFQRELSRLLPGITIRSVRAGNESAVNHCHYCVLPDFNSISKSQYFYKKKPLEFIHFSSLEAVQAIVSSKKLRLYNLYNLNDPREYSFAGDLLTFNAENREDAKRNMFLLSMCKTEIFTRHTQYEFNMWRLYGRSGTGVAIQLDFSESPLATWKHYYLSQVFYGSHSRTNLKELNSMLIKFQNDKPSMTIDLGQIVAFHKSNLYKLEKEVRLLFDNRQKRVHGSTIYSDHRGQLSPIIVNDDAKTQDLGKHISFLELPIFSSGFERISEQIPIPKIKKLVLGYSYSHDYAKTAKALREACRDSLGYDVPVEPTRLTKYYSER